ncbi:MAG: Crp/Fnr family transcriptional regulator [Candidatus Aenigmarchaeota archaeon]|nr:Crp/Fnr family transcriptional regulator [Candidatus Aenigmarchaeota archaeon]
MNSELWTPRNYERGEKIYSIGDVSSKIYRVSSGLVKSSHSNPNGRVFALSYIAGEMFGLDAFFNDKRDAETMTLAESKIDSCDFNDFVKYMEANPSEVVNVLVDISLRTRYIYQRILEMSYKDIEEQTLSVINRLSNNGNGVNIRVSDLGDFMGATRESTSRAISSLQERGILSKENGTIYILERELSRV